MISVEYKNHPQTEIDKNDTDYVMRITKNGRTLLKSLETRYYHNNGRLFAYFNDNSHNRGIFRNAGIDAKDTVTNRKIVRIYKAGIGNAS